MVEIKKISENNRPTLKQIPLWSLKFNKIKLSVKSSKFVQKCKTMTSWILNHVNIATEWTTVVEVLKNKYDKPLDIVCVCVVEQSMYITLSKY